MLEAVRVSQGKEFNVGLTFTARRDGKAKAKTKTGELRRLEWRNLCHPHLPRTFWNREGCDGANPKEALRLLNLGRSELGRAKRAL